MTDGAEAQILIFQTDLRAVCRCSGSMIWIRFGDNPRRKLRINDTPTHHIQQHARTTWNIVMDEWDTANTLGMRTIYFFAEPGLT